MNINWGKMRITEVPFVEYIDVSNTLCEIKFAGLTSPIVFTKEHLQEFYAAIGEALKYSGGSLPTAVQSRVWHRGDPEPTDVTSVFDCDGDKWVKELSGIGWRLDNTYRLWEDVVGSYGPVREWQ